MQPVVEIAPWPGNRRFAYSITYDDGLVEVLGFAWRLQREFGIPGHVNVYPARLGKLEGDTSAGFLQTLWHLRKYAEPAHLRGLADEGWSIGCQGEAGVLPDTDVLAGQRRALEDCLGRPVASLALPSGGGETGANAARAAGYRWLMLVHDELNPAAGDDGIIWRSPLYHLGPAPNHLANDPYRLLAAAADARGWVVDVVRLVDRYPADPARDCTPAELKRRFHALAEISAGTAWPANVEEVAAYRSACRATHLEPGACAAGEAFACTLQVVARAGPLPERLTFLARVEPAWQTPAVYAGAERLELRPAGELGTWLFDLRPAAGLRLWIGEGGQQA